MTTPLADVVRIDTAISPVRQLVSEHLGVADDLLDDIPTVTSKIERWRHISIHAALDTFFRDGTAKVYGVPLQAYVMPSLSELLITPDVDLGPIDHVSLPNGPDSSMACIQSGLIIGTWEGEPFAAWMHLLFEDSMQQPRTIALEVKTVAVDAAQHFIAELQRRMSERDPYRGKSLKLDLDRAGNIVSVDFDLRPTVTRDQLILHEDVLERIEGHAIGIGRDAERLRAAGRHLKRGLLLYGPPGTGKTHTVRYLASELPEATLFVLTGGAMNHVRVITSLLSALAPVIVVLDDVDLIAEDRSLADNAGSALFNLLDAMDGMREDVDVLFVCTSNRADTLEKAIAARPGRIDQAVEVPVPDAQSRRRLLDLYARGLDLQLADVDAVIERTEGVTASFIKELLRRATLAAMATQEGDVTVTDAHMSTALDELLDPSKPLTSSLLGIHTTLERTKQRGVGTAWCGV